jgi:hypothetical protein
VDTTWSPTAACSLSQAADELLAAASTLGVVSASMGPLVNDAKTLAASILGSVVCAPAPAPVYLTVPGSGPADAGKDG